MEVQVVEDCSNNVKEFERKPSLKTKQNKNPKYI